MQETPKRVKFYHRFSVRVTAGVLAVIMLFSVVVIILSAVQIEHIDAMEGTNAANNYLADNNRYIEKNLFERAGQTLTGMVNAPVTLQEHYTFAERLIARGDYEGALPHINACIGQYEGGNDALLADLWMKKGCILAMLGEYDDAIMGIDEAIRVGGSSSEAYLVKAQIYLLVNDAEKAMDCLGDYLAINPSDLQAQASMAELYSQMGRYQEAVDCYSALIAQRDSAYYSPALYLGRAGCLLLLGDVRAARVDIDAFCEENNGWSAEAKFLSGLCSVQNNEYRAALTLFEEALDMGHESPALCYEQMAQCYFMMNEFEKTIGTGKTALEAKGEISQPGMLYRQMGVSAMALEKNDDAIEYFTQAIRRGTQSGEDRYYRGICYMGKGEYELAIEDFTAAIQANAMTQDCYYYRGLCYLETDDIDTAILDFKEAATKGEDKEIAELAEGLLESLGVTMGVVTE